MTDEQLVIDVARKTMFPNSFLLAEWRRVSQRRSVTAREFVGALEAALPILMHIPAEFRVTALDHIWKQWPLRSLPPSGI